jgi:hypothetical protein
MALLTRAHCTVRVLYYRLQAENGLCGYCMWYTVKTPGCHPCKNSSKYKRNWFELHELGLIRPSKIDFGHLMIISSHFWSAWGIYTNVLKISHFGHILTILQTPATNHLIFIPTLRRIEGPQYIQTKDGIICNSFAKNSELIAHFHQKWPFLLEPIVKYTDSTAIAR